MPALSFSPLLCLQKNDKAVVFLQRVPEDLSHGETLPRSLPWAAVSRCWVHGDYALGTSACSSCTLLAHLAELTWGDPLERISRQPRLRLPTQRGPGLR